MRKLFSIISLLMLPVRFCFAQELDQRRIEQDWNAILTGLIADLQKDTASFDPANKQVQKLYSDIKQLKFNNVDFNNLKEINNNEYDFSKAYNNIVETYVNRITPLYRQTISATSKNNGSILMGNSLTYVPGQNKSQVSQIIKQLQKDTADLRKENTKLKAENVRIKSNQSFWVNWKLYLFIVLLLGAVIYLLKKFVELRRKIVVLKGKNHTLNMQNTSLNNQMQSMKERYRLQSKSPDRHKANNIDTIEKELEIETNVDIPSKTEHVVPIIKNITEHQTQKYKYLCQLSKGRFLNVQDNYDGSSSYYRMFNIKDYEADFEFYGDSSRAIKNWSSILDSAAQYDDDPESSSQIKTIVPGKIVYDAADECWKIVTKAKLKLY